MSPLVPLFIGSTEIEYLFKDLFLKGSRSFGKHGILERFKTSLVVWRKIETIDKIGKCVPDNR